MADHKDHKGDCPKGQKRIGGKCVSDAEFTRATIGENLKGKFTAPFGLFGKKKSK